nr:unnamed protein product [Spirometra erinaceieuropaei]
MLSVRSLLLFPTGSSLHEYPITYTPVVCGLGTAASKARMPKSHKKSHRHKSRRRSSSSEGEVEDDARYRDPYENDEQFRAQLSAIGLVLRDVPSDGNCMFHAFSDQLFGTFDKHALLRRQAVNFLRNNKRELLPFCEEDEYDCVLHELAKLGTFGDHTSLVALSRYYSVDVVLHQVGLRPIYVAYSPFRDPWTRQCEES